MFVNELNDFAVVLEITTVGLNVEIRMVRMVRSDDSVVSLSCGNRHITSEQTARTED
jgi:hypothetical protein